MSYEGRSYFLCKNGHVTCFDALSIEYGGVPDEDLVCFACGEKLDIDDFSLRVEVDDTNCESASNSYFELVEPEEKSVCEHCGSIKTVKHARYKIVRSKEYGHFHFDHLEPWKEEL